MNIITIYSIKENVKDVVSEFKTKLSDFDVKTILFFASTKFDPNEIGKQMKENFNNSSVFGCTTSGEIVSGKMLKNSVVAIAFNARSIEDISIEVVENIKEENNIDKIFSKFEDHYNISMKEMNFEKYVGIILADGLAGAEEKLMDKIGDLTNVQFVGASAGDDLKFEKTHVFANGKAYTNAAVLALIKPVNKFSILKTQSFNELPHKFVATKVNESNRQVLEFNNKPAAIAYSEAIKCSPEKSSEHFMRHPVGLMIDNEPYVRSPQQIKDNSIIFYCNIIEGMELSLLESRNIVEETKIALSEKLKEIGHISGIINFNCILRTLELEAEGQCDSYGKLFNEFPTVGFSTYGEEYIGHINQTATMLIFS